MREDIIRQLDDMDGEELRQVYHLLDAKKRSYHQPLAFLLAVMGFKAVPSEAGSFAYVMDVSEELKNRYGIVHGGVISTFIDTAMAETAFALDGELKKAVTLHLTVNFIKSVEAGQLHCVIAPAQNGHRIALFNAIVYDAAGEIVASGAGHFYKSAPKPVQG